MTIEHSDCYRHAEELMKMYEEAQQRICDLEAQIQELQLNQAQLTQQHLMVVATTTN